MCYSARIVADYRKYGYPDLSVFQATGPSVVRGQQSRTLLLVQRSLSGYDETGF